MEITDILMTIMVVAYSITIFFQPERTVSTADGGSAPADPTFTDWGYYWKTESGGLGKSSWFTKNGKILLSAFLVIIFGLNIFVFKSDWIATILFSMFIVFNYADYFRMEGYSSQCVEVDGTTSPIAKKCNFIIPSNKYYGEKYYELRIGYGTLILGTGLILAYRDIKSKCDNIINKVVLMTSPLIMMLGLLLISAISGESPDESITNRSFDYIHSYFKGVALPSGGIVSGDTATGDDYKSYITSTYGYNNRGGNQINEIKGVSGTPDKDEKVKISRIQNKIYFKMFLLVAFFGYLWYWALNNDGTCDFDFTSPGKLFSKSPTYMIIFIVLSPFIIKNIMMNECSITTAESTYTNYEETTKEDNFGSSPSTKITCMFDKIGGLGIYLLMCMLCMLIYSSSKVGHTLNVPMVTVLLSGILGYMISPSGDLDCSRGVVQPSPNTGEEEPPGPATPTTCRAWGGTCPPESQSVCEGPGVQGSTDSCIPNPAASPAPTAEACGNLISTPAAAGDDPAANEAACLSTGAGVPSPDDCQYVPATAAVTCSSDADQISCPSPGCTFTGAVPLTENAGTDDSCNGTTDDCQRVCCQE